MNQNLDSPSVQPTFQPVDEQEKRDILNRVATEQEERYRIALEATGIGTWDLDLLTNTVYWDDLCKQLYGFHKDDVVPYDMVLSCMHPDDAPKVDTAVKASLNPSLKAPYDIIFRTIGVDDKQLRWLHCKGIAKFVNNEPIRFTGTAQDITQQYQQQQQLKASELRYRDLIENNTVGIVVFTSRDMVIDTINDTMLGIWGKDRNVIGKTLLEAMPELKEQRFLAELQQTFDTGIPHFAEEGIAYISKHGAEPMPYWFQYSYRALYDIDGKIYGIINTATEITSVVTAKQSAKEANQQLQDAVAQLSESREQLRLAIESADLGFWSLHPQTQKIIASQRLKELFGFYSDEEMMFDVAIGNIREGYREQVVEAFEAAITEGKSYDIEYPVTGYRDGRLRWLRATGKLYKDDLHPDGHFAGTAADITEQKLGIETITQLNKELQDSIEKLSEQEEILRIAIRSANIGLWQINLTDNATVLSDRMKTIHGIPPEKDITFDEALSTVAEEFRQPVRDKVTGAIESGGLFVADYKINRMDGSGTGWVHSTGIVRETPGDGKRVLIGACIDITERKLDEQRRGDFIGMVSHELRNPLTSINGYMQMLFIELQAADSKRGADLIGKSLRQVDRMRALITGFLDVARMEEGKIQLNYKVFDMAKLVKAAEEESLATITSHRLVFEPVEYMAVEADPDKIEQVIINFINNAVKYSPKGSTITIACINRNGRAHVSVTDKGIGIPAKDQPYIFDRFYRVEGEQMKKVVGFGIGLYICKEVIGRHDGQIGVQSTEGKGSTFWFDLPVHLTVDANQS